MRFLLVQEIIARIYLPAAFLILVRSPSSPLGGCIVYYTLFYLLTTYLSTPRLLNSSMAY